MRNLEINETEVMYIVEKLGMVLDMMVYGSVAFTLHCMLWSFKAIEVMVEALVWLTAIFVYHVTMRSIELIFLLFNSMVANINHIT